jgi:hypothetical protein
MALFAGLPPEKFLRVRRLLCHPLGRSEHTLARRDGLPGQIPLGLTGHTQLAWMSADVFLEFPQQENVNDLRCVMWNTGVEAFVKGDRWHAAQAVANFTGSMVSRPVSGFGPGSTFWGGGFPS